MSKTKKEWTAEEIAWEKQAAQDYFQGLTKVEIGDLGDELVNGNLDLDRWFAGEKQSSVFMNEIDRLRILAEI